MSIDVCLHEIAWTVFESGERITCYLCDAEFVLTAAEEDVIRATENRVIEAAVFARFGDNYPLECAAFEGKIRDELKKIKIKS
jgi:hypothetical protein